MDGLAEEGGGQPGPPRGLPAVGIFLFFGAAMAALAGSTLVWPGTFLDRIWVLNAPAHRALVPLGKAIGLAFLLLGATLAVAGAGWYGRRLWGWRLAVAVIASQLLGDLVNALRGDFVRGGAGFLIAGALLAYLLSARVRGTFAGRHAPGIARAPRRPCAQARGWKRS